MSFRQILTVFLFLNFSYKIFASDITISTDRPSYSQSPRILPVDKTQIEIGSSYEDRLESFYVLPNLLIKRGLSENLELRLSTDYIIQAKTNNNSSFLAPVFLGLKYNFLEKSDYTPMLSLIAQTNLDILQSNISRAPSHSIRLASENKILNNYDLITNISFDLNNKFQAISFSYNINNIVTVTDNTSLYFEYYSFKSNELQLEHYLDLGLMYLIKSNIQVDISSGIKLNGDYNNKFIAIGFSYLHL
jgi:hypothetical protein